MATPFVQQSHAAGVVLGVSVVAFGVGELLQSLRVRRGAGSADLLGEVLFRVLFFAGIVVLPLSASHVRAAVIPGGAAPFVVGAVVGWFGLLLRWWCFVVLGRYFTVVLKTSADQVVVDRGPYRVLRHPSYTGLLLAFVGGGLMLGNWLGLLGSFVLVLVALVYRIRIEERALNAALGSAYADYARHRARLLPYFW
jgi:protein-S-isoprenylcysteine O-methyltransferase Ste14